MPIKAAVTLLTLPLSVS